MSKLLTALVVAGACLGGCTTVYRASPAYPQPATVAPEEVDLVPPVPSFVSVGDCELAYGAGACGSGAAVYETAGIAVPVGAEAWYVPFAFGVMTGVLLNDYFAPPGVYVADFQYRSFTSTTVIDNYKSINQTAINNFRQAPPSARAQASRSGPVRYSPARGAVTGAARLAGSAPSHVQNPPHPGAASTQAPRRNLTANASAYNPSSARAPTTSPRPTTNRAAPPVSRPQAASRPQSAPAKTCKAPCR